MSLYVSDFLDSRTEEIARDLRKTSGEYALTQEKLKRLYESVDPIIMSKKEELSITHGDCLDLQELFQEEFTAAAIMHQTLYQQGYLDCVKLLKMLGVLI